MAQIKKTVIKEKNISVFSVHGNFSLDKLLNEIDRLCATDTTLHSLWDFTNGVFPTIKASDVEIIIEHTRKYVDIRKGGKSAIVVSRDLGYGMARMYDTLSECKDSPVEYRVFRDINEATNWIEK